MKRFFAVLGGLLVLPAFAEVAPVYYDEVIGYEDAETPSSEDVSVVETDTVVVPVAQPSVARRTTASRVVPTATNAAATRSVASGRVVASTRGATGAVTARGAANARAVSSRATVARSGANSTVSTRRAVGTAPTTAARASIVQTDTVNKSLYSGSRVGQRAAAIRARSPITTSIDSGVATVSVSDAVSMDELAQVTDFCKAQYTSCMDNYCNVLDDNQGRCSCSKNIKNYEKTENALKDATAALQDIAQQIQYIGLTGDQVETLFAQTEAELSLSSASDSSQIKSDLDRIKDLIVEVKSGTASSTAVSNGISMDFAGLLDFSFDSFGIDMSTFFGGAGTGNTSSISNQRGEQLYKTAAARCKAAVLNDCSAQGVDIAVITNSYDLEIDKQCLVYERSLKEANDNMSNTVRNAKNVLQRARLMVAQNKNAYDLRGCINALDSCMQDDYVCGAEYEYCLDPSGKYIVQGELVLGSRPNNSTDGIDVMWNYGDKNAWTDGGTLSEYINESMLKSHSDKPETANIAKYLQQKIGYIEDGKAYGMCASVLNQCQDYTYNNDKSKREYKFDNEVVKTYLERTLVQIKAAQDEVLNDYAQNCISDVTSCLADNGWSMPEISEDMTEAEVLRVYTAIGSARLKACKPYILSCADANHFEESMISLIDPEEWTKMSEDMKMQYFIYMEMYGRFMDTTASQITALECEGMANNGQPVEWVGVCRCVAGYDTEYSAGGLKCIEKSAEQLACESRVGAYWNSGYCGCRSGYSYVGCNGGMVCLKQTEEYKLCEDSGGWMNASCGEGGTAAFGSCNCGDKTWNETTKKCE